MLIFRLERALGNTFLGISWLIYSFIKPIWGVYSISIYDDNSSGLDSNALAILKINFYLATITFGFMCLFAIAVLVAKLYGVYVSLNYCKKLGELRTKKLK